MKDSDIDTEIWLLQNKELEIENQGQPNNYMVVKTAKIDDGQYVFTQPSLVVAIINDANFPKTEFSGIEWTLSHCT